MKKQQKKRRKSEGEERRRDSEGVRMEEGETAVVKEEIATEEKVLCRACKDAEATVSCLAGFKSNEIKSPLRAALPAYSDDQKISAAKNPPPAQPDVSSLFAAAKVQPLSSSSSMEERAKAATPTKQTVKMLIGQLAAKAPSPGGKIGTLLPTSPGSKSVHAKRLAILQKIGESETTKKGKKRRREEENGEDEEMKENESATTSSTATTPKIKKKKKKTKLAAKDSATSPHVDSSAPTTPKLKKKKKKQQQVEPGSAPSPAVSSTTTTSKLKKKRRSEVEESAPSPVVSSATTTPRLKKKKKKSEVEESAPSPAVSSTTATPKLKKRRKSEVEESAPSPAASSTTTTPKSKKKKKTKRSAINGEKTPLKMEVESHELDGKYVANGAREEGSGDVDVWPTTRAFVPTRKEDSAERKRVKVRRNLAKKKMATRAPAPEPTEAVESVTVPTPQPATVPSTKSGSLPAKPTVPSPKAGTVPAKPTVPGPAKNLRTLLEETMEKEEVKEKKAVVAAVRTNGRIRRVSSPEVSTTSSESSDDEEKKRKEEGRRKKMVKKKEMTSAMRMEETKEQLRKKVVSPSITAAKSFPVTPKKPPKSDETPSSMKGKKKRKEEREEKKGRKSTVVETAPEQPEEEERVRPSSDLLQMVAARLANSHGLMVFRLICAETRRIADRQLRFVDDVLHLSEFDDENSFTRDDMTPWWEQRREAEDTSVKEGKENRSHAQISAYLKMRSVEKRLLRDMDGGISHPGSAASSVDVTQLVQHPLATLDAACLLHSSQSSAAMRLLRQQGARLQEVWLGQASSKLRREVGRLPSIERFEHRQATMDTLSRLPMLQMTELRLDIVDDAVSRRDLAYHLVNGTQLRALELNVAPSGPHDGNTASQCTLFTRRSYDRADYADDLQWMIPNVEEGHPDPVTLCMPSLEHLATNVANVKLFWQLRDATLLLRHLRTLRVGTLTKTLELVGSCELFADTKESRRYRQSGFFALRDAHETELESVTLRLGDRVGVAMMARETATIFEAIGELPPSLRRLSLSLFYNQFSGVCAPFRKWTQPEDGEAPDTDHVQIEKMHLHFERAFDLRGLPALLPVSIKTLSIALNYDNEEDARCFGPFLEMLPALATRLEALEDLHIQVWGVRCLQPLMSALSVCSSLAKRLTRLAVAAYPVDEKVFESSSFSTWLNSVLPSFPRLTSLGLHAAVLARMIPEQRRSGYSWRNGLAWLANESLGGGGTGDRRPAGYFGVELATAPALPLLDDGEDYTITPHWEVEYDAAALVLAPEDEEEQELREGVENASFSGPHGSSDDDDDFITSDEEDEEEEHGAGDASHDALEQMEHGLEDETERLERREKRRDEKERAAIERGELPEGEEEDEGEVIDFDSISDGEEEEETKGRSEFFDDEAEESDRGESADEEGEEEEEGKQEESADSECSSEDDEKEREEERRKEEERREKRRMRKQAALAEETDRKKRKRVLESDDEEEDEVVIRRPPKNKRKKVIIDSDDE